MQSACSVSALRVFLFRGRLPVTPSSYIKLVKELYRQRIYHYLVQFQGMLHCWLQSYHARIRTLDHPKYMKSSKLPILGSTIR